MGTEFEYTGIYEVPSTLPDQLRDIWKRSTKAERARILSSLLSQIPNSAAFLTKIADASSDAWEAFVSADWPNAQMVKVKQRVKLAGAYDEWNSGVSNAFAEGGTFETNVENKAPKFDLARVTIGAVGMKAYGGWGPTAKAAYLLNGETIVERYLNPTKDSLTGHAYPCFKEGIAQFAKPTIIAMLNQGIILAYYAHSAGLSTERDAIISQVNTNLSTYLAGVVKSGVTATCEIVFMAGTGKLQVHAKAETS
jgi:hypothetical protein